MPFSGAGLRARLRHEVAEMLSFRLRRNAGTEAGATDFFTGSPARCIFAKKAGGTPALPGLLPFDFDHEFRPAFKPHPGPPSDLKE